MSAKGYGYDLKISLLFSGRTYARISIESETQEDAQLLNSILDRSSNRNPFSPEPVADSVIEKITENDWNSLSVLNLSEKSDIEFIAKKTSEATSRIMREKSFREELSKWVRNNLTNKFDGMPGYSQGMPLPPSLIASKVLKNVDVSKTQAKTDSNRVRRSSNILLILSKDREKESMLNAGRLYAHICILAKKHGLDTSGVGAAAIDPKTREDIKKHYELDSAPVTAMRIGKANKVARHTPRWPAVLVRDF